MAGEYELGVIKQLSVEVNNLEKKLSVLEVDHVALDELIAENAEMKHLLKQAQDNKVGQNATIEAALANANRLKERNNELDEQLASYEKLTENYVSLQAKHKNLLSQLSRRVAEVEDLHRVRIDLEAKLEQFEEAADEARIQSELSDP